jgi:HAD superfamily hydrolase (TIGR01662 family)
MVKVVFIDRDGTIGGNGGYCNPKDFKTYPYAKDAIDILRKEGFKIFLYTAQRSIGDGTDSIDDFVSNLNEQGIEFDDCFFDTKKHSPGKRNKELLMQAIQRYGLKPSDCYVIGDRGDTDIRPADEMGFNTLLVKTGVGNLTIKDYPESIKGTGCVIADDLMDAATRIQEMEFYKKYDPKYIYSTFFET